MTTLYRAARTMPTVIGYQFADADGEDDAIGVTSVVATATSAAGSTVVLPAVDGPVGGVYSVRVPGQPVLDQLTITWSGTIDSAPVVDHDVVDICGGHYFSIGEARLADGDLTRNKFSTATLRAARVEIETEFEEICGRAFVPRYRRITLDGTDDNRLILPDADVRVIRSVRITTSSTATPVDLDPDQLAALVIRDDRSVARPGGILWPFGEVQIGYEYGMSSPPPDLKRVSMVRLRSRATMQRTQVPDRAMSWTNTNGDSFRLSMPGAYRTGVPEVDAVLDRYSLRPRPDDGTGGSGGNPAPADRTLNFDPQYYSLFHGGQR